MNTAGELGDHFTADDLHIAETMGSGLTPAIENAAKPRATAVSAGHV